LLTLPLDILSTDNIIVDIFQGAFVVLCSLAAFISLVWLREQILSGGGPEWLENEELRAQENADIQNNINRMNRLRNMRRQHQVSFLF
jgi:E3 ubiquitin-protein ligase MARCH6